MRMILALPSLDVGGAERQAVLIANNMAAQGHRVTVVVFKQGGGLTEALDSARVELVELPVTGLVSAAKAMRRMMALTAGAKVDVIYSFLPVANLVSGVIGLGRKNLRIVWGVRSSIMPMNLFSWKVRFLYWLEFRLMWMADGIITNSRAGQAKIPVQLRNTDKMITVPNAVDTDRYFVNEGARQALRSEYGLVPGTIAIGIVARLDRIKDHFTFVRAAARFSLSRDDGIFFIIGDGDPDYRSDIVALVDELGLTERFVLTGNVSDVNAAYNMLDIAALTSVSEGFPNAVGEAMATATPCSVTDVGDCMYLVGDPEMICPVGDDAALAAIWLSLADDGLRAAKSEQARKRVSDMFSIDNCLKSTIAFLDGS